MNNKRNTRKGLIAAIVICSVILAVLLIVAIRLNLTTDVNDPSEPVEDMVISTDMCSLYFPGQWKDQIRTDYIQSDDGGTVSFYGIADGKETEIFAVRFSRSGAYTGNAVGVLDADGESILVSVNVFEVALDETWSNEERDVIAAMQEDVNYLLEKLCALPGFSTDTSLMLPEQEEAPMEVSTPFGTLYYPGQWDDQVWAEFTQDGEGGNVTFYGVVGGENVMLFQVTFGSAGEEAAHVGYVQGNEGSVEISVEMFEPENPEDWNETDLDTVAAMQEGINELLSDLKQSSDFTAEPVTSGQEEDVTVSTPYGDLFVPAQWQDQMDAYTEDRGSGYAVTFVGTVGEHEETLFTVLFNADMDDSLPVGTLNVNGESVSVSVKFEEILMDDAWTAEEADTISAMQESINYILEKLGENPGFTAQ